MYKVIRFFTDLQDNDYPYNEGDTFPRDGLTVDKKRIAELSGPNNKQRTPLIRKEKEEGKLTKTDIKRMPVAELRKMATDYGVLDADSMTGDELKEYLIGSLGL